VGLAHCVLLYFQMPLIGSPAIRAIARDTTGRLQRLALQTNRVLPLSKPIRHNLAHVVIHGVPEPARMPFALDRAPHLLAFSAEPTPHLERIRTPSLSLLARRMKMRNIA
jgi:hypothetical protein